MQQEKAWQREGQIRQRERERETGRKRDKTRVGAEKGGCGEKGQRKKERLCGGRIAQQELRLQLP